MELYLLDSQFRRVEVIDRYESLIWTERFSDVGDFELVVYSTSEIRDLLTIGSRLALNESYRVMVIETVNNTIDNEGRAKLKITGRSLEYILQDRISMNYYYGMKLDSQWPITGTPGNIMRYIFAYSHEGSLGTDFEYIVDGDSTPAPNPVPGPAQYLPGGDIAEPADSITAYLKPGLAYDMIKEFADIYDLGFRIIRRFDTSQLYFEVYPGSDRTTLQTNNEAVIFSQNLESLSNSSEVTSSSGFKNVALVFSNQADVITVYGNGATSSTSSYDLRQMIVQVSETLDTATTPELYAELTRRGKAELAKHTSITAFDGEVSQVSKYKYGTNYNLGDLVEMRSNNGIVNTMRVTEQIFVSDSEGDRSYPTLTIKNIITPGSWYSWDYGQTWDDYSDDTTTWSDL